MRRAVRAALVALVACVGCGDGARPAGDAGDARTADAADAAEVTPLDAPGDDAPDAEATETADAATDEAATADAAADGAAADVPRPVAPTFSVPVAIDKIPAGNAKPTLAIQMDDAGNAFAIWRHSNAAGSISSIEANRFDIANGSWSVPMTLEDDETTSAADPDLSVDPAGNAVVVWSQGQAGLSSIWSNWYDAGTKLWRGPVLVEIDETGEANKPQVAALPGGGAVAVWYQWDGLVQSLWVNQLADGKWTGRAWLETTDSADAIEPDVAADPNGNAVAVWTETGTVERSITTIWSATRAANASAWSAPVMLAGPAARDARDTPQPHVALDASGDGFAIWALRVDGPQRIWARRYHGNSGTWDTAVPIDADDGASSGTAQLALDAPGDAFVTWRRVEGQSFSVWANRFLARTGTWGTPQRLDESQGDAVFPAVAAGGDQHAVVVWQELDPFGRIFASRFAAGPSQWTAPARLDVGSSAIGPQAAVDPAGNAFAIWSQRQGDWDDLLWVSNTF